MTRHLVYASLRAALLASVLVLPGYAATLAGRSQTDGSGLANAARGAAQPQMVAAFSQASPAMAVDAAAARDFPQSETTLRWLLDLGLAPVYGTVAGLSSLVGALGQVTWEIGYALGVNGTPVAHSAVTDELSDLLDDPADDDEAAAKPTLAEASRPTAASPLSAPAAPPASSAAPGAAEPAARPAVAGLRRPGGGNELDSGLLANFIYDRGARRPDGSFFVPKTLQRLFQLRTERVHVSEVPMTMKLPGQIVSNPHSHGAVDASLMGRYEPPPDGLPVLGDTVTKGQLLGFVFPAVGVVDVTQVRREVARLTTEIRMETENLEILKQFSFVPFREGKIYQAQQKVGGLRREREALLPLLQTREVLRASTSGVISRAAAVSGRMIHPGDTVFEVINPAQLWVEATAADPVTAADAARVQSATALTPERQLLTLAFVGSGLALKQQATPIMFSIVAPPEGLRVGRPVTVTVNSEARLRRGLPMSRAAVTVGTDGIDEAWEQTGPETFLPHPVRVQDIDGATVLVLNGLAEGARVVVRGTKLLAQLQ